MLKGHFAIAITAFLISPVFIGFCAPTQQIDVLHGVVVYPDGSPVEGATVTAKTECDRRAEFVQRATTLKDGSFSIPIFDPECPRYRFTANKRSDFWLETGEDIFTAGANGTAPKLGISSSMAQSEVTIKLGQRGGIVDLRVWDIATNRYVRSHLDIDHQPENGKTFGSEMIATGEDGSSDPLLLPAGQYTASVLSYPCGDKEFWVPGLPPAPFTVVSGTHRSKDISIDVRQIKPLRSTRNPRGKKCKL